MEKDVIKDDKVLNLIDKSYETEDAEQLRRELVATAIVELDKTRKSEIRKACIYGGISYLSLGGAVYSYVKGNFTLGYVLTAFPYATFPEMFHHAIKAEELGDKLKYLRLKSENTNNSTENQITEEAPEPGNC